MNRPGAHRAGRPQGRDRRVRSQAGFSLIETIVALFLVSVVVLALAAGMFTLLRTTAVTSRAQRMQAALTTAAESAKGLPYKPCAVAMDYGGTAPTWDDPTDDATVEVLSVRYWDAPGAAAELGRFTATCPAMDLGAQRVTVQVTIGGESQTAEIVKRQAVGP